MEDLRDANYSRQCLLMFLKPYVQQIKNAPTIIVSTSYNMHVWPLN